MPSNPAGLPIATISSPIVIVSESPKGKGVVLFNEVSAINKSSSGTSLIISKTTPSLPSSVLIIAFVQPSNTWWLVTIEPSVFMKNPLPKVIDWSFLSKVITVTTEGEYFLTICEVVNSAQT